MTASAFDQTALRRDVEALAAMERRSASAGERASAEWVARRLGEAGAVDVRLQEFRYQHTYATAQGAHFAAGLAAALIGGRGGTALAAAAAASFDLEFSGRSQWLRRLLPAGTGVNAIGRVPARGERRRTLVLVAHHDAAHTGLMWHPRIAGLATRRAAETGRMDSFAALPTLAFGLVAAGSVVRPGVVGRALRATGGAIFALSLVLGADVARGATVPGASDNAAGVAATLALVERFAREPLDGTELVALFPGCEESGMGGMAAWLRAERAALDPRSTLVLGLDTLGAGEPIVLTGEGPPRTARYRAEDVSWAERGARHAGLEPPRRFRIGGWTDPILAAFAGLPAVSILSVKDGAFTNYHLPTDTPDHVDWTSVERCLRIAEGTAEAWSAAAADSQGG